MGSGGKAGSDANRAIQKSAEEAYNNVSGLANYYKGAADIWTPERNLRDYDDGVNRATDIMNTGIARGEGIATNAYNNMLTEADIAARMNPYRTNAYDAATRSVRGGAGAALQSAAADRAVARSVGDIATQFYDKAADRSYQYGTAGMNLGSGISNTALQQGTTTHDIYNTQLQNRMTPGDTYNQMMSDAEAMRLQARISGKQAEVEGEASDILF
jgi:hypothetical protein